MNDRSAARAGRVRPAARGKVGFSKAWRSQHARPPYPKGAIAAHSAHASQIGRSSRCLSIALPAPRNNMRASQLLEC
jgi:hypothetical protein